MSETWYVIMVERGEVGILATAPSQATAERKMARLAPRASAGLLVTCDLDFWQTEAVRLEEAFEAEEWWASFGE